MEYVYEGPGPQEDPEGGIARPGDVREFPEPPAWGPWRPVDGAEGGVEPSGTREAATADDEPPAPGSAPPVTTSGPDAKGM